MTALSAMDIHDVVVRLEELHGRKAAAEAARRATEFEQSGDAAQSAEWRRIEAALKVRLGPHQS